MTAFLEIDRLRVAFPLPKTSLLPRRGKGPNEIVAVDGVTLAAERGTALGLVGESGSGKSTIARCIVGLVSPTGGEIRLDGVKLGKRKTPADWARAQMVFQDPSSSLNPSRTVAQTLVELLLVHGKAADKGAARVRAAELLELVGLSAAVLDRRPRSLSGGQRQRVGIARALALDPQLLIADEAVAALDVSIQASVINTLRDLKDELDLTMLFISHDLAVVRNLCDTVAVMYLGSIVEQAPVRQIFDDPQHPYTAALLAARPDVRERGRPERPAIQGEAVITDNRSGGCAFRNRCPYATDRCANETPVLTEAAEGHLVACHHLPAHRADHHRSVTT